jgi:hypothetical protein
MRGVGGQDGKVQKPAADFVHGKSRVVY